MNGVVTIVVDQIATIVVGWRQLRFIYCSNCEHCANYDHIKVKNIQTVQFTLLSGSDFYGIGLFSKNLLYWTIIEFPHGSCHWYFFSTHFPPSWRLLCRWSDFTVALVLLLCCRSISFQHRQYCDDMLLRNIRVRRRQQVLLGSLLVSMAMCLLYRAHIVIFDTDPMVG